MNTCLIFHFYAPARLLEYSFFDIGKSKPYFDEKATLTAFRTSYDQNIKPALKHILKLARSGKATVNLSFTGSFLEFWQATDKQTLVGIKELAENKKVTLLGSTYNHSIASLFSKELFTLEIQKHRKLTEKVFGVFPRVFLNTENIYFNDLAPRIKSSGYEALITEALAWHLNNHSPYQLFYSTKDHIILFLNADSYHGEKNEVSVKQYNLSDGDLAIDKLIRDLQIKNKLISVEEALDNYHPEYRYDVPMPIGTRHERHFSYFSENAMQKEAIGKIRSLTEKALELKDETLQQEVLLKISALTCLEYFMEMNYKKLSSLSGRPYDFYISFMNILSDLELKYFYP